MRNVRVFFKKYGRVKFASHLDMNRYMIRALRRSKLPIWYTEGFNPHPYITFALPLSLGFESDWEVMDMRLVDDSVSDAQVVAALSAVLPQGIEVFAAADPVEKPGKIAFATFEIFFEGAGERFVQSMNDFLQQAHISVEKKGKKGKLSTVELAGRYRDLSFALNPNGAVLKFTLPAGGSDNLNPTLYLTAAANAGVQLPPYSIRRTALLNGEGALFR